MSRPTAAGSPVDLLLLAIVAGGPIHGYAIVESLRERSDGTFDFPEGTVYPALYRLERQGLLRSRTQEVAGRPRRLYLLTAAGRRAMEARAASWRRLAEGMAAVLKEA
jgi:DNA-binding PadR family transcriptional regulator